jgi:hypothetical protein
LSTEANFTVEVCDTVNNPEYVTAVALVDGSVPSVVYEVLFTPDPPVSLADSATVTLFRYQPVRHVELLHEIVVVGAAVSVGMDTDIC